MYIETVTERALLRRINRKLSNEYRQVHKTREPYVYELGEYHLVDHYFNTLVCDRICLETLGKELEVMGDHEELVA